jgi:Tat protein secretion system quality control protein TatD with DNase activity
MAQKLAEIKNISVEEVANATTANADKLFSL